MGDGGAGESRRRRRRRRRQSHGILSTGSSQEVLTEGEEEEVAVVVGEVVAPQVPAEEEEEGGRHGDEYNQEEQVDYVDQNRNLNLSEIAQQDKERQQLQQDTNTVSAQNQEEQKRHQANVSPILSLSSASEQSGSGSDCCTTNTTARMSQASSLVNEAPSCVLQHVEQDASKNPGDPMSSRYGRQARFATDDLHDHDHDHNHDHEHERTIICMMPDDSVGMSSPYVLDHFKENDLNERTTSLVRSLGRRVSLLPRLMARRMSHRSATDNHDDDDDDDARRFSLQTHDPLLLRNTSGHNTGEAPDEVAPASLPPPLGEAGATAEPVVAVAGVGGTITTVTRSKRKTAPLPRLVAKNGQVNLFLDNIDRRQYVRDLFTTMIDIKWRYNLMAAAFGFVFSWLFFACIWYLVLYFHDDLAHENDPQWSPCIVNVYSFPAALLFSIETQSTLGFGSRIISVECPGAIVIFCSQLIFGVVVECLIVGMVFAKLSRPTKRSQTIMYSKYATVCLRESKMCLTFRVGDVRSKSHIIGATIRASLVSSKITQEGEHIPFYHYKLNVHIDDCKQSLLLIWPVTIVHIIDETSPFYELDSEALSSFKFEIITVLEGTVESTGQSIQVRSSYLPSEVKWGYRFEPIVSTHGYGRYAQTIIDYNKFNRILEVPTPRCSPLDYYKTGGQQVTNFQSRG